MVIRTYGYTFVLMEKEKRKPRSYKVADTDYRKAMGKCKSTPLANIIEDVVKCISAGGTIDLVSKMSSSCYKFKK